MVAFFAGLAIWVMLTIKDTSSEGFFIALAYLAIVVAKRMQKQLTTETLFFTRTGMLVTVLIIAAFFTSIFFTPARAARLCISLIVVWFCTFFVLY